jgi:hypothetical protein
MGGVVMASANVRRIIFREVMPGDLKKFTATAAPSGTGGGARDLRFRPFNKFDGVFARMFPNREKVERTREGEKETLEIYSAMATVIRPSNASSKKKVVFEGPTTARPNEGRLTCVHDLNLVVPQGEGRFLILLIEDANGGIMIAFYSEHDLASGQWHAAINDFFKQVFAKPATRNANQGYIDFALHTQFIKFVKK